MASHEVSYTDPMFFTIWKQLAGGKTLMRGCMNSALRQFTLDAGTTLDIGGGKNPSYFNYLGRDNYNTVVNIDKQYAAGKEREIDFEKDTLPYADASIDQVLMLNVLEHIYHHAFLVGEVHRVLKEGKQVIGFVPFLINYHADPHDYFRYTDESLQRIFSDAGFKKVEIRTVGYGPFSVNLNNLTSFMPRIYSVIVWPFYYLLDRIIIALSPNMRRRFPLGYLFVLTK